MKENKFLFYGCIITIIACAAWSHFGKPYDAKFVHDEPKPWFSENTDSVFIDNSNESMAQKTEYKVSHKCEAPRPVHHIIYEQGNIIDKEYDTYNSQCMCMVTVGNQKPVWFDLKDVNHTMFESKTAEETTALCNDKCQTVCETGFEVFLNDNLDFKPFADGEFVGCSSQFELQSWGQEVNGQSTERYYSTNTISCQCAYGDNIVEKTEMYQYFSEPNKKELDCNKKCAEICAE